MTGRSIASAALLLCAGCFSSSVEPPKTWTVTPTDARPPAVAPAGAFSVTRQGALTVGRFGRIVPQSSSATADVQVEVLVRDLSLDCSDAERRETRAAVSVDVLRASRGARAVILSGDGSGTADAKKGDYSAAFSQAFDAALANALRDLKAQPPPQSLETTPKGEQK